MSGSIAVAAKEIVFSITPEGGSKTEIAEVTDYSGLRFAREIADVTHYSTGFGRARKPLLNEIVDVTMDMNFVDDPVKASFPDFLAIYESGDIANFSLDFPESLGSINFDAYVSVIEVASTFDSVIKANATLAVDITALQYTPA